MVISGLVFQCDPARVEDVAARLSAEPGLSEIAPAGRPGCLVGVLEAPDSKASVRTLDRLKSIPGIYAVLPTYIQSVEEDGT